ncbi:MAG: hypothetical protein ACOYMN_26025, partial [Roseimicrobium sp.]
MSKTAASEVALEDFLSKEECRAGKQAARSPRPRTASEPFDANDERVTATHESAHAVVQIALRLGVERVEIARVANGNAPSVLGRSADRCPELDRLKRN